MNIFYLLGSLLLVELLLLGQLVLDELVGEGGWLGLAAALLVHHPLLGALPPLGEQLPS